MSDPWHDEELDALVVYLESARGGGGAAWAVVEASSVRLADEVVERLSARLGAERVRRVQADAGDADASGLSLLLEPAPAGTDVTVLCGLSEALTDERAEATAHWLNLRREELEQPGEARVVLLTSEGFDAWLRRVADLHRYAQHFRFIDWEDLFATAQAAAAELDVTRVSFQSKLADAEARVERARALDSRSGLAAALTIVADWAYRAGDAGILRAAVDEALVLTQRMRTGLRFEALRWSSGSQTLEGRTRAAMETARQLESLLDELPSLAGSAHIAIGFAAQFAGDSHAAEDSYRRSLHVELASDERNLMDANLAEIHLWRGRVKEAGRRVRSSVGCRTAAYLVSIWGASANVRFACGELGLATHDVGRALQISGELGGLFPLAESVLIASSITLSIGKPTVAARLLGEPLAAGIQTARTPLQVWTPALVAWALGGPSAVEPVVTEHTARQATWDAPIPAAELAFARGLAAADDDDARHHLQDASDRYRAMDGKLYLAEIERRLARLDRLAGDLDRAEARVREGLTWHHPEGARPAEARDRIELAMIALGRGDAALARQEAQTALALIRECGTRLDEPAALVALAAAECALGHRDIADAHDARWRRQVAGMEALGLAAALERDAAWAAEAGTRAQCDAAGDASVPAP